MSHDEWHAKGTTWDEGPELWELQTGPNLTVGSLQAVLDRLDPDLPVRVETRAASCEWGEARARRGGGVVGSSG